MAWGKSTEQEILEYLQQNANSALIDIIARQLDEKFHFSRDVLTGLNQLRESVSRLEAPGKSHDQVLAEVYKQISDLVAAAESGTRELKEKLEASDRLRQDLFASQLATLDEREKVVAAAESEMRKGFPELRKQAMEQFAASEDNLTLLIKTLDSRLADLTAIRDEYTRELSKDAMERLSVLSAEIDSEARRLRELRMAEIQQEIDKLRQEAVADREEARTYLQEITQTKELSEQELEKYNALNINLEERKMRMDAEVDARVRAANTAKDTELKVLRKQVAEYASMQEELEASKGMLARIEASVGVSSEQLSKSPEVLVNALRDVRTYARNLETELTQRPSDEYWKYKDMYEAYVRRENELNERERRVGTLESERILREKAEADLHNERDIHEKAMESLRCDYDIVNAALKRHQKDALTLKKSKDECYAFMEDPANCPVRRSSGGNNAHDVEAAAEKGELEWLNLIYDGFTKAGFTFNRRILDSFHTALKNNDLSPLTVLAGVSGTGKSELPRLYAKLGGLNYFMIPVLPNWDSPESLLGFYNSLDNRFESQPLAHFLAQCTNVKDGFRDQMNIVLLDEMNLAHVELYFAEFLSLMERRRGEHSMKDAPKLKLMLASGVPPYEIPVSRNVLWTGTMNQDETTKALSDKVLDRSSCIFFPRPTSLYDRGKLSAIEDCGYRLTSLKWREWRKTELNADIVAELKPYKTILEEINNAMGAVGRAVGHRVWQSIAYYMANYPSVCNVGADLGELKAGLKFAFEDQLVQKVMPKLRGVETRGRGKSECLDKIHAILAKDVPTLEKDFSNAMQFGQGQFLWLSAEYLQANNSN